jgi:hypothetical protein
MRGQNCFLVSRRFSLGSFKVIFLVNFVNHAYQFPAPLLYPRCSEQFRSDMVPFLKRFLLKNKIDIALEEGGNPLRGGMRKAREQWGFEKTFLQEAIDVIPNRAISHGFVDISKKEANQLVEKGIIDDVSELTNRPDLRDKYIAQAARQIFSKNKGQNGLLLVASDHFAGVKDYFTTHAFSSVSDTIETCEWYKNRDQRDLMYCNEKRGHTDLLKSK